MRRGFLRNASAVVCVASGLTCFGGDVRLSGQTAALQPEQFQLQAITHKTSGQSVGSLQARNERELSPEIEIVSAPPPTRSSFMATWLTVSDAEGYLLDVSTGNTFDNYLDGYHDLDVGNANGHVVTGLRRGTTYYYRVRAYGVTGFSGYSDTVAITTEPTTGLTIQPTFDSSITGNQNAAAIQAMINLAISYYESLFNDPITIQIRFRYATTEPDGSPLPQGLVSQSDTGVYIFPWNTYVNALRADAHTNNDNVANASLPGSALSTNMRPSSANGRAVGLNTPPAMFANGTVGQGGQYDGIVTLNSSKPFQFSRPINGDNFDAQRITQHEIDEVIGLGSRIGQNSNDLRPQDLFSWSSAGHRNITSSGTRYLSINGGITNIVRFNQDSTGDFGDWLSEACPQSHPYVQNAFTCMGQSSDIAATSPEGVNLDVIGYDLVSGPPPTPSPTPTGPPSVATNPATNVTNFSATLNGTVNPHGLTTAVHFEYGTTTNYAFSTATQNYNGSTVQNVLANLGNLTAGATYHFRIVASNVAGTTYGSDRTFTTPVARAVVADFSGDGHLDLIAQRTGPHETAALFLNDNVVIGAAWGPTLPAGWSLAGAADFDSDGRTDYVLFNSGSGQTVIAYLSGLTVIDAAYGPSLPAGWELVAIGDINGDGHPDYVLYKPSTHQTTVYYLNNNVFTGSGSGPTLPAGWNLVCVADFDGDGHPDYALFNSNSGQTVIGYLSGTTVIGAAFGPTLPNGWPLVAAADFDGDGNPDYLLYNPRARQTAIGYLNNNVLVNAALGPVLPAGWSLVGQ